MNLTQWVMVATIAILSAYDVYAALKGGIYNTISYQVTSFSKEYPILPFALGVLCGHFFWQMSY